MFAELGVSGLPSNVSRANKIMFVCRTGCQWLALQEFDGFHIKPCIIDSGFGQNFVYLSTHSTSFQTYISDK